MNPAPLFDFSAQQLRESRYVGWIHATGIFRKSDDKADFHAMTAI